MRIFISAVLAASLSATGALAETSLAAGKPTGVRQAQGLRTTELYVFGFMGLLGLGLGVALIGHKGATVSSTTTG